MSNFNSMQGGSGASDTESAANLQTLLAQFRRQPGAENEPVGQSGNHHGAGPGLLSHFNSFGNSNGNGVMAGNQSFYDTTPDSPQLGSYPPAVESSLFPPAAPTPPVQGHGYSQYPPAMMKSANTSRDVTNSEMSANLLNLLKYSGHSTQAPQHAQPAAHREPPAAFPSNPPPQSVIHAPAPAAADPTGLLAALMRGHMPGEPAKVEPQQPASTWNAAATPDSTQQYLLNLLNRPKPSQEDVPAITDSTHAAVLSHSSVIEKPTPESLPPVPSQSDFSYEAKNFESFSPRFESDAHAQQAPSTQRQSFGYGGNNPFEDFSGSSPVHRTPKSSTTPGASRTATLSSQTAAHPQTTMPIQILKKPDSAQSSQASNRDLKRALSDRSIGPIASPEHTRQKLDHAASPLSQSSSRRIPASDSNAGDKPKESVADAMSQLAETADNEAQEALARAEEQLAQAEQLENEQAPDEVSQDLADMMNAKTDEEFVESAQIAASAVQRELEREESLAMAEETSGVEDAAGGSDEIQAVKDLLSEAGVQSPAVADSWEVADIIVTEKRDPIKVHNLPMKPWITVTVQGTDEPRATFPDDAVLDIARLKKDFDQIDRNLVAVSDSHIAYGMSKSGGFCVIRQEDGKDARLFTKTEDRIFNVAISSSATNAPVKESIICTGVVGSVYWVLLRNGDRDHVEDANPEQYGFALPPITSHDGETPGGVLKTRARASCNHPEYFAVGRGKSIHIIWPSFILYNKLFKSGHDRVVDTELLLKQCSLKINTGKAGKDFTFSEDDTVMVSLDKSGRVKFWDVRELTAASEDSDPSNPLPAHLSLEVKEPLMTLTTTPEGEKAWPTSVLLLDKYRPYQKRTALRYLIVGMKQNHTLQLWDLALGKAVQEFHFPHNKESDAVCSVMYHAPTSMIVVGHPTRNSIYLLHLSAPKYSLRSLTQVEFVQRLEAKDPSIPQPDSTAVISGIREYSFAPQGILRSLTILETSSAHSEPDEPTLFDLYAMHSRGVTCISIKQAQLGWTRDNKVMAPVDAVETGYVKISKLPTIQPSPSSSQQENGDLESATPSQVRIATRTAKDLLPKTPSSQGEEKKAGPTAEVHTPVRVLDRSERNEEVDSTPVPAPTAEKPEKKSRRKKAADREISAATANNGASEVSRATPQNKAGASKSAIARNSENPANSHLPNNSEPRHTQQGINPEIIQNMADNISNLEDRISKAVSARSESTFRALQENLSALVLQNEEKNTINQVRLLDRVAQVLSDSTGSMAEQIIQSSFDQTLMPFVSEHLLKIGTSVNTSISRAMGKEIHHSMPLAVNQVLPDVLKQHMDRLSHEMKAHVDAQTQKSVNQALGTLLPKLLKPFEEKICHEVNSKFEEQKYDQDNKMGQLIDQMSKLGAMVKTVAETQSQVIAAQAQMQQEFAAVKQQLLLQQHQQQQQRTMQSPARSAVHSQQLRMSGGPGSASSRENDHYHQPYGQPQHQPQQQHQFASPPHSQAMSNVSQERHVVRHPMDHKSRERVEAEELVEHIRKLMQTQQFQDACLAWLSAHSRYSSDIFEHAIQPFRNGFVQALSPLHLLSVAQLVSLELDFVAKPMFGEKCALLNDVLQQFAALPMIPEVVGVTPNIMKVVNGRLEHNFSQISVENPSDPYLKTLKIMLNTANRLASQAQSTQINYSAHY